MPVNQNFINQIKSANADARFGAVQSAWQHGADQIVALADVMASGDANIAKSAREAMEAIVHFAARPKHAEDAAKVASELVKVAADAKRPKSVRGSAIVCLGFAANGSNVADIAKLLNDADVREDARMSLERIPGDESLAALQSAASSAPAEFKPHLEQSVTNRKTSEKTIGTTVSFAATQPSA